jgi:hypothetical protein
MLFTLLDYNRNYCDCKKDEYFGTGNAGKVSSIFSIMYFLKTISVFEANLAMDYSILSTGLQSNLVVLNSVG